MRLPTLLTKLRRDLSRMRGQTASIAVVLASGIVCFLAMRGCYSAMARAIDDFYDRYRFAHVFAHLERAPESVARELEALPGVASLETRVTADVSLPLPGLDRPAYGRVVSLPEGREPTSNALYLKRGRAPASGRGDEVALLDSFAAAHGFEPGARIPALIGGRRRSLQVVGIALSPEFVHALRPGAMVDDPKRSAVLWMQRPELAAAFGLSGSFNDVVLSLEPGASEARVLAELDHKLARYGGTGAVGRKDQTSHRTVSQELAQVKMLSTTVPVLFLGVAAFLVNLVLGRMIRLQRPTIALLKAIGYGNLEVGAHYLGLVAWVLVPSSVLGLAGGYWLGRIVLGMYAEFFRLPGLDLSFELEPGAVFSAIAASAFAAFAGAFGALRNAVKLPPAEAMLPPAPARYRRGILERFGLSGFAGPSGLMVLREIARRPLRSLLSACGIAGAVSLVVLARFGLDSLTAYFEQIHRREQRQDVTVAFSRPVSPSVVGELRRLPGVLAAEGLRAVPIRISHDHRTRSTVLLALAPGSQLRRVLSRDGAEHSLPGTGVVLEQTLARLLELHVGDRAEIEVREGERRTLRPFVSALVDESSGLSVYGNAEVVAGLVGDLGAISAALLTLDPRHAHDVHQQLLRSPRILDVVDAREEMTRAKDATAGFIDAWTAVVVLLAGGVVIGVVYNNARIGLAARARDLATLRVLGFRRREVSLVLLGAEAVEVLAGIPLGLWLGTLLSRAFMANMDPENVRWNLVILPSTYVAAVALTLLGALGSALWVRRSLDALVLSDVLKGRE